MVGRRDFLLGLGGGLVAGAMGDAGVTRLLAGRQGAVANTVAPATIDANTIRRRGVGFRGYDPARASPGFTLFAPLTGTGEVYLIDIQGNVVHTWNMPYPPGLYGYLTEKGTLLSN